MVARCERCNAEFADGTVFCDHCGRRIVVGMPDMQVETEPYFAYQCFGETHLYTAAGWTIRFVLPQALIMSVFLVLMASLGPSWSWGVYLGVAAVLAYALLWSLLIRLYRKKGAPLDFGGSVVPGLPSASQSSHLEHDHRSLLDDAARSEGDDRGAALLMSPKRR